MGRVQECGSYGTNHVGTLIYNMVDELVIFYIHNLNFFLLYSQASAKQVFGWSNFAVIAFDITILVNSHPFLTCQ